MNDRTRRGFLLGSGAAAAALAGCSGGTDGGDGGAATDTATDRQLPVTGSSDVSLDHPSARGINEQPTLGDRGWQGVIVAYEDPSCPTCRRFNRTAFGTIKDELIASEQVAYVFRGYPVVYEWGGPATQALEATYARDAGAMWDLKDHYFEAQGAFTTDNVLDRTRQFLADNTPVDGEAVVADVTDDAYRDAVQSDYEAGQAAGASRTPTFYLFRDGEHQTTVSGAQDFTVFENVLVG